MRGTVSWTSVTTVGARAQAGLFALGSFVEACRVGKEDSCLA